MTRRPRAASRPRARNRHVFRRAARPSVRLLVVAYQPLAARLRLQRSRPINQSLNLSLIQVVPSHATMLLIHGMAMQQMWQSVAVVQAASVRRWCRNCCAAWPSYRNRCTHSSSR